MRTTVVALTAATAMIAAAPGFAEEVEHPAFASWARHPVGTAVVIRAVTETNGRRTTTSTTTSTLVELKKDAAGTENRKVSDATVSVVESPPDRYEQAKMFPILKGMKKEDIGKPLNAVAQGEETLKIAGREIKTIWFETRGQREGATILTRTWLSD